MSKIYTFFKQKYQNNRVTSNMN